MFDNPDDAAWCYCWETMFKETMFKETISTHVKTKNEESEKVDHPTNHGCQAQSGKLLTTDSSFSKKQNHLERTQLHGQITKK